MPPDSFIWLNLFHSYLFWWINSAFLPEWKPLCCEHYLHTEKTCFPLSEGIGIAKKTHTFPYTLPRNWIEMLGKIVPIQVLVAGSPESELWQRTSSTMMLWKSSFDSAPEHARLRAGSRSCAESFRTCAVLFWVFRKWDDFMIIICKMFLRAFFFFAVYFFMSLLKI